MTPEQRRELEAGWSSEDRSIMRTARRVKSAVLLILILSLAWLGAHETNSIGPAGPQVASTGAAAGSSGPARDGGADRASR